MNLQEEQEVVTLSEICRVCLIKTNNMKHLLEANDEIIQIITKLSSISNVEIEINDTLPCFLCNSCEEKLKISYDFQQLCQKSHNFILACLSASSVSFKVNSVKPLHFEESPEKSTIQSVENNTDEFINFVDNDGLEKKLLISYYSMPDIPDLTDTENCGMLKEIQENTPENCVQVVDNLNSTKDDNSDENIQINTEVIEESNIKPSQVEKRTKYNQTMRLPQFSRKDVEQVIKKFRERFLKHVNCLHCGFMAKDSRALSVHMTRLHKNLKEHWCMWCNNNFNNIQEHVKTEHKDNFKCPLCGKYKMSTGHFMEHLASHSVERSHVCRECGKSFISERHLKLHFRIHGKQSPYQCRICSKSFKLLKTYHNHLKTHNKHKCKVCEGRFSSVEEYKTHKCFSKSDSKDNLMNTEEEKETEDFQESSVPQNFCKMCNKRVRSLQKHLASTHSNAVKAEDNKILQALCSFCGKTFKNLAKLTIHMRSHTGEMPYKCSYCDKRMRTRVHLVMHERTHTGERPHVCKFCGKGFAQSSVLNTHLKQHTGKTEECSMCQKRFCRPSELKQHMKTHTGERPYECKICGQEFAQKNHLVGHNRKHTDERPYHCNYCEKSFKQGYSLRCHLNIHFGKKPYKCSECPYESRQKHCLKQHMLQHEKEPKPERDHKCEMCGQSFMSFEMYSLHYSNEHGSLEGEGIIKEGLIEASAAEVIEHLQEFT